MKTGLSHLPAPGKRVTGGSECVEIFGEETKNKICPGLEIKKTNFIISIPTGVTYPGRSSSPSSNKTETPEDVKGTRS